MSQPVTYNGIEFQENWTGNFEEFKRQFEYTHVFLKVDPEKKLSEMKKVFNQLVKNQKPSEEAQKE